MLHASKENENGVLTVHLSGSIDERVHFTQLFGEEPPRELHVYCKDVPRINSEGVRSWVEYFQDLSDTGTKIRFYEVSTALIEQFNLISNFGGKGEVESFYVPFHCNHCKAELMGLFQSKTIQKKKFRLPKLKCTRCGGEVAFDDIQDEYFSFITRKLPKSKSSKKKK